MEIEHTISIETEQRTRYTVYFAVCSCGKYRSVVQMSEFDAQRSGRMHTFSKKTRPVNHTRKRGTDSIVESREET